MIELGDILAGLIRRTTEGRLNWTVSFPSIRFVASIGAISVVIMEVEDLSGPTTYRLEIHDEFGRLVEVLTQPFTSAEEEAQLERLFMLARRKANGDSTLETLAKALEL